MSENHKETVNRLIEKREMQLSEIEVLEMLHTNKKNKAESEADKAKQDIILMQLPKKKEEVQNEISELKELL